MSADELREKRGRIVAAYARLDELREKRERIVAAYDRLTKQGVQGLRLTLAGRWYDVLEPSLLHEVGDQVSAYGSGREVFVALHDGEQVVLQVTRDMETERSYFRLEEQ